MAEAGEVISDAATAATAVTASPPVSRSATATAGLSVETASEPIRLTEGALKTLDTDARGEASLGTSASEESVEGAVFLTEHYKQWERLYLLRLAKEFHRYLCDELDGYDECLVMMFIDFDLNLDGVLRGEESERLIECVEEFAPGSSRAVTGETLLEADGSVHVVGLLRWFEDPERRDLMSASAHFQAIGVTLLGSGYLKSADERLEALSLDALKRNVVGYRRILGQVRRWREDLVMANCKAHETINGVENVMDVYHKILFDQFEDDDEYLFELFCEVDVSGNLLLEIQEVEAMLRKIDTSATQEHISRYILEINVSDGALSFTSLKDWWEQAFAEHASLVSQKGQALMLQIKAESAKRKLGGLIYGSGVEAHWDAARSKDQLEMLTQAYLRTYCDIRDHKLERDLRTLEYKCAML